MPVFDFNNAPEEKKEVVCTYTTFSSNEKTTSAEKPILVLDNKKRQWKHHSSGKFTNPTKATTFEFEEEDGTLQQLWQRFCHASKSMWLLCQDIG